MTQCVSIIGGAVVTMADTVFHDGFVQGRVTFEQVHRGKQLTDVEFYELLVGTIIDVHHSGRWNAGYITGWMAALFEKQQPCNEWLPNTVRVEITDVVPKLEI